MRRTRVGAEPSAPDAPGALLWLRQGRSDCGSFGGPPSYFIPVLEEKAEDQWAGDMIAEAKRAIGAIRGD